MNEREKIGELAVKHEWISAHERDEILLQQDKLRQSGASFENTLFGLLLEKEGLVSRDAIEALLQEQNAAGIAARDSETAEHHTSPQNTPAVRNFYCGDTISDKYQIVDFLGQGGMGEVYKVTHKMIPDRFFALKVLHSNSKKQHFREKFISEIQMAMEFSHKHVVNIRDFGELEDGRQYFTMDFSPGVSLQKILKRAPLLEERALQIARQILNAISHAHQKGIIHCDLKPSNILVETRAGQEHVLVLDFGIAREVKKHSSGGEITGTVLYMSPEQAMGEKLDARTDIYSTGVILYEMVTGKRPFLGDNIIDRLKATLLQTPIPPRQINPQISFPTENLLDRAMARDRDKRPTTANVFLQDIDTILAAKREGLFYLECPALARLCFLRPGGRYTIGRSPNAFMQFPQDFTAISREQLYIDLSEYPPQLVNKGKNTVHLNGISIAAGAHELPCDTTSTIEISQYAEKSRLLLTPIGENFEKAYGFSQDKIPVTANEWEAFSPEEEG